MKKSLKKLSASLAALLIGVSNCPSIGAMQPEPNMVYTSLLWNKAKSFFNYFLSIFSSKDDRHFTEKVEMAFNEDIYRLELETERSMGEFLPLKKCSNFVLTNVLLYLNKEDIVNDYDLDNHDGTVKVATFLNQGFKDMMRNLGVNNLLEFLECFIFIEMNMVREHMIPAFIKSKDNNPELHEKIKDNLIKEGIKVSSLIFNISSLRAKGGRFDSVKNDTFSRMYDYLERILLSLYNLSQNPEYDFHFKIDPNF